MTHESFTLTRDEFKRMQRDMRSLEKRVSNTEIRRRTTRRSVDAGAGGSFRWAFTPIAGIPAANFDPTGGSDSLGLLTPGQATCSIIETNSDAPPTYEIRTGNAEVIFNGVQSAIAGETIIGISRHRDGNWFVIVEDCLATLACTACLQDPAATIHVNIRNQATAGTCLAAECDQVEGNTDMVLTSECRWQSTPKTISCAGDFTAKFEIIALTGNDVTLRLTLSVTGPPAEDIVYQRTPVDITTLDCSIGSMITFLGSDNLIDDWTLCGLPATGATEVAEIIMSAAP